MDDRYQLPGATLCPCALEASPGSSAPGVATTEATSNVLALISHVLDWQDRVLRETAVEVDGRTYVPPWTIGADFIPAHRLAELVGLDPSPFY